MAITSRSTDLQSLLDALSDVKDSNSNEIQLISLPEGIYVGNNIDIKHMSLKLSGERSNERSSPGTQVVAQSETKFFPNEESVTLHTGENCIFSLTNSSMSLDSLQFNLIANSEERRQQENELRTSRLAIVTDSMLTISESTIEVSSWTSAILISRSKLEEPSMHSSVMMRKCSISNDIGKLRGLVETEAFPPFGGSHSVSLVGCSFNSQAILGTDGISFSLTRAARKNNVEVGMISSSLISCSFVNMSSIGCSRPPHVSELSQRMLGCVVWLSSSHLSGSTIRDMNAGGSVLCSNSSFSSLLSSPNTDANADSDPSPSITLPDGTHPEFEDGKSYDFTDTSGDESSVASFSHCHFTGANSVTNVCALRFEDFLGSISVISCSFSDHTFIGGSYGDRGGAIAVWNGKEEAKQPLTVEGTNFTNLKATKDGASMYLHIQMSATIVDCRFEDCGADGEPSSATGGISLRMVQPTSLATITNLVFESCYTIYYMGGMRLDANGAAILSDCLFDDCYVVHDGYGVPGMELTLWREELTPVTRLTFTDCRSRNCAAGMTVYGYNDLLLTDVHFLRCKSDNVWTDVSGGGFYARFQTNVTLTMQDCSFVECSSNFAGGALGVCDFGSCVITDCLVKDCCSGATGAIRLQQRFENPQSVSLTRVAFINNSIGQAKDVTAPVYMPDDSPAFVDVCVTAYSDEVKPNISIVDCFTTCAIASMGMGVKREIDYMVMVSYGLDDDAFDNVGPRLTERVELSVDGLSERMELGMKVKIPIASQKYEVTIRNEVDKTEMKEEIEFVNGKATLKSPSPTFNLDFSTSYTITSIVGIVPLSPSSSSSLSNALSFPLVAWTFNLDSNPSFFSFTTPEKLPTLNDATSHLIQPNGRVAVVFLHFDKLVVGSFEVVVEEGGKEVSFTVEMNESAKTGESSEIVVVGEDRLLTHNTTTESPFVKMNGTIAFHIPKSSYVAPTRDNKKAMSPEMKKLLSWLIPVVICVCVALIVIIVVIVLVNRRRSKANIAKNEMEEQEPVEVEKMIECGRDDSIGLVGSEGSAISEVSRMNKNMNNNSSTLNQSRREEVEVAEVMMCSGNFKISTVRMNQTLYSVLHEEGRAIGKREIGIQVVNGLKEVVAHRGRSDVLTHLSSHWILLDSAGTVQLKLDMNSSEAEQEAARQRQMQQVLSTMEDQQNEEDKPQDENQTMKSGTEKSGMDDLRWRASEVVASEGRSGEVCVDGSKASVFSLGLVLWEIETGQVPFGELDAVNAQRQSGTGIGPKMDDLKNEEFVSLIHRCVSVDLNERPTLSEIGEFLSSHPEDTRLPSDR
ncbi:hypothetical protein BLNAU_9844 [Blattamonas nauphoetae]|uniref:Protein kinase domain-containing protein n=1 Tax=Blattamonas nauphoetae TaxID=2049346 RepID=A0ABQ9XUH2_9EUKA|nr:hypothetical protein BLNAU_9844 [Blattamonas nauphoetae]